MTLQEILKAAFSDVYEVYGGLTFPQVVVIIIAAVICGGIICLTYRLSYRGALFSRSFCVSLFALSVITTLLIMAVRTNTGLYISIGTLGVLSVIRFRATMKEPLDMAYIFLSVTAGFICGSNLLGIALPGVLLVCIVLGVAARLPRLKSPYILMVTCDPSLESKVREIVSAATASARLKSKSVLNGALELTLEVRLKDGNDAFLSELSSLDTVTAATLVRSNTEYI